MVRRSFVIKKGRYFAALGWGKSGPYVVGTLRKGRAVAKASFGTKGAIVGGRVRVYRRIRLGGEYNLTHHRRGIELRLGKKRLRFMA